MGNKGERINDSQTVLLGLHGIRGFYVAWREWVVSAWVQNQKDQGGPGGDPAGGVGRGLCEICKDDGRNGRGAIVSGKQIEILQKWREQMIADCLEMIPDVLTDDERKAYRAGLSTGWRETINVLSIQGMIKAS